MPEQMTGPIVAAAQLVGNREGGAVDEGTISETSTNESSVSEDTLEDPFDEDTDSAQQNDASTEPTLSDAGNLGIGGFWIGGYGAFRTEDNTLVIGDSPSAQASFALYDESGAFTATDYTFTILTDWKKGKSLSLTARFSDYGNYVQCSFSEAARSVGIINVSDGSRESIAASPELPIRRFEAWRDISIGIKVEGSSVACIRNGTVVLRATIEDMPGSGTIGIGTWGEQPGDTFAVIKDVTLEDN
jgi:hypothetical protein